MNTEKLRERLRDCKFTAKRALLSEAGGSLTVGLQKVMEIVDAALAATSAPSAGVREAEEQLRRGIQIVGALNLARVRMEHILETAASAMTHAEVRMTRDVIAQITALQSPASEVKPPKGEKYRAYFFDLRGRLLTGQISMEAAEAEASPVIAEMDAAAKAIAKRHGKRFKGFSFAALVR